MEPSLRHIIGAPTPPEWIFVGGKGGVGKTTTSSSLALSLASTPISRPKNKNNNLNNTNNNNNNNESEEMELYYRRVLLLSTDPAHNVSDAFNQLVGDTPTRIKINNNNNNNNNNIQLYAMEIDPSHFLGNSESIFDKLNPNSNNNNNNNNNMMRQVGKLLTLAARSLPGIDEVAVFVELLRGVQYNNNNNNNNENNNNNNPYYYDVIVFDTAPTGHTLKLLSLPQTLHEVVDNVLKMEELLPLMEAASIYIHNSNNNNNENNENNNNNNNWNKESIKELLESWRKEVSRVQEQMTNPLKTIFVVVCIAEFLSVYETERLLQELMKYNINCDSIVINQLLKRPSKENNACRLCEARIKMQNKYLLQIKELYSEDDFHLVEMPLLSDEVRGANSLSQYGQFLREPYNADVHGYIILESPC